MAALLMWFFRLNGFGFEKLAESREQDVNENTHFLLQMPK